MNLRSFAFVLIAVSLLAFGSFAAACGDNDEARSIEEYFERLDELGAQFEAGLQEVDAPTDGEVSLNVIQKNLANTLVLYASFVDGVSDLAPPDEFKGQHDELVGAMRAFDVACSEYADDISNVVSLEELQALATDEELAAAGARSEQACLVMEQLAADNDVEVDLNC